MRNREDERAREQANGAVDSQPDAAAMSGWGNLEAWMKGIAAAGISGGANGIVTGFAAIGIDPSHFNLAAGLHHTLQIAGISAAMSAILGVALFLRQSPLPRTPDEK
jgi:hypothetical protein